jgi:hypothetical protein
MNKKYFLPIVLILSVLAIGSIFKVLETKITNNVIQKLKREYVPGPYSPGIDPENLDQSDENVEQSSSFNEKYYNEIIR